MEEFLFFHDFTIVILVIILRFVGVVLAGSFVGGRIRTNLLESQVVECI